MVIIDEQRTFADALAIRLRAEEDITATTMTRPAFPAARADIALLDATCPGP